MSRNKNREKLVVVQFEFHRVPLDALGIFFNEVLRALINDTKSAY